MLKMLTKMITTAAEQTSFMCSAAFLIALGTVSYLIIVRGMKKMDDDKKESKGMKVFNDAMRRMCMGSRVVLVICFLCRKSG